MTAVGSRAVPRVPSRLVSSTGPKIVSKHVIGAQCHVDIAVFCSCRGLPAWNGAQCWSTSHNFKDVIYVLDALLKKSIPLPHLNPSWSRRRFLPEAQAPIPESFDPLQTMDQTTDKEGGRMAVC